MSTDDSDFARIISTYLEADMPAKHGMTPGQYVEACRALWDACKTDPDAPYKLLMDELYSELVGYSADADYFDPRVRESIGRDSGPDLGELYCIAVGHFPVVDVLRRRTPSGSLDAAQAETTERGNDLDIWAVAFFDVLGFENMYRTRGPHITAALYEDLLTCVKDTVDTTVVGIAQIFKDTDSTAFYRFDLGSAYFSDTILLWTPLSASYLTPFLARCSDLIVEAAKRGMPLRGALAAGEGFFDKERGVYLGTPIIDAARLEHEQDWIGAALAPSFRDLLEHVDSDLLIPFTPPCKPAATVLHCGFALDWPRRAREFHGISPAALIKAMPHSPRHRKYYENALAFVDTSLRRRNWNRVVQLPVIVGAIRRAVVQSRSDETPLPPSIEAMLSSLSRTGAPESLMARSLQALARGSELPTRDVELHASAIALLDHLKAQIHGNGVIFDDVVLAAEEARLHVRSLNTIYERALQEPDSPEWALCVPYLRALASGAPLPSVPKDISADIREALDRVPSALCWKSEPIDIEMLIAAVLYAAATGTNIDRENERRLSALDAAGASFATIASMFRAVVAGEFARVTFTSHDATVASVFKMVEYVSAWQRSGRYSIPEALQAKDSGPSGAKLCSLAHQIWRRTTTTSDQKTIGGTLDQMDAAGPPHDAVARFLRVVLTEAQHEVPGGLQHDAHLFLCLVRAHVLKEKTDVDLAELCLIAFDARRERRRLTAYEDAVFRLISKGAREGRRLVTLLRRIARRLTVDVATARLSPDARAVCDDMIAAVHRAEVDDSIWGIGIAALRARLKYGKLSRSARLQFQRLSDDHRDQPVVEFLNALATNHELPDVPKGLSIALTDALGELRLMAICETEHRVALGDVISATVSARIYGEPLSERFNPLMQAMEAAGAPYDAVALFLRQLGAPGTYPTLPAGAPTALLIHLGSARLEVFQLERSRILVRRPTDPESASRLQSSELGKAPG